MTCGDVERLLDAFLDTELPPSRLLEVARHAASCTTCDEAVRQATALTESISRTVTAHADTLDFSGVWRFVEASADRHDARLAWRRRIRSTPVWGAAMAIAASAMLWLRSTAPVPGLVAEEAPRPPTTRVASAYHPRNQIYIDRLAGKGVAVRREPKSGTTIIWVNHTEPSP